MTTLTTVGFGDISASTDSEMFFAFAAELSESPVHFQSND